MSAFARHQCLIYEGAPSKHLAGLASVIVRKLKDRRRCLYLNSPPMIAGMRSYISAQGVDVEQQVSIGALVLSSECDYLVGGRFEPDCMLAMLDDAAGQATKDGFAGLWASGDITWELGPEKDYEKLLHYECGIELLFRKHPNLCGICQYHRDTLPVEAVRNAILTHKSVYINETLSRINPHFIKPELLCDPDHPRPAISWKDALRLLEAAGEA